MPEGPEWEYEVKWDGYRMQALKEGKQIRLLSRNGADFAGRFAKAAQSVAQLKASAVYLDGEIVVIDEQGRPSFQLLQNGLPLPSGAAITYYVFDLLYLGSRCLCDQPLKVRRSVLEELVAGTPLRFSPALDGTAAEVSQVVREHGLEGVVAKRVHSAYEPGMRNRNWVKLPLKQTGRFFVGGIRPAGRQMVLLVGHFRDGRFRYAGKVRYSLGRKSFSDVLVVVRPLRRGKCPFPDLPNCKADPFDEMVPPDEMASFTWLNPEVTAEVKYTEWTRFGALRQPELVRVC